MRGLVIARSEIGSEFPDGYSPNACSPNVAAQDDVSATATVGAAITVDALPAACAVVLPNVRLNPDLRPDPR
jgi:hypothetical protein